MNILEMAMVAKMAGGNDSGGSGSSDTGPIDPKRLPEGYPYKEQSETEIVVLAETAVSLRETQGIGMGTLTPSDYVPLVAGQKYFVTWNGVRYETVATTTPTNLVTLAVETENGIVAITAIAAQSMYGIEAGPGLYTGDGTDTLSISTIGITETIHTMAPEFLPAGVGGGVQVVTITAAAAEGGGSTVYTSSHTGNEIAEMATQGAVIANVVQDGTTTGVLALSGVFNGYASFAFTAKMGNYTITNVFTISASDTTVDATYINHA